MLNYEENERALMELFQDLKTVPGTLPPVYTCGEVIIGYDREGQIRVMASIKRERPQLIEDNWLKRWHEHLVPLARPEGTEQQGLIDNWIRRWHGRRWRLDKAAETKQHVGQA